MKIEIDISNEQDLVKRLQEVAHYTGHSTHEVVDHALRSFLSGDNEAFRRTLFAASLAKHCQGRPEPGVPEFAVSSKNRRV